MTAKVMTILLTLGLIALGLLSQRQQRLDTAYRITRIHQQSDVARTKLWNVRSRIAEEVARQHHQTLDALASDDGDDGTAPASERRGG